MLQDPILTLHRALASNPQWQMDALATKLCLESNHVRTLVQELIHMGAPVQLDTTRVQSSLPPPLLSSHTTLPQSVNMVYRPIFASTQQYLLRHLPTLAQDTVCCCEYQTAGQGQHGRSWLAGYGHSLLFSIALRHISLRSLPCALHDLPLHLMQAIATLENGQRTAADLYVKAPNDLFCHGKKCAGLLVHSFVQGNTVDLVIGLGANMTRQPEHISRKIGQSHSAMFPLQPHDRTLILLRWLDRIATLLGRPASFSG